MQNNKLSILLMLCVLAGCISTRRGAIATLGKIEKKHPDLFSRDTVIVDSSRVDTIAIIDETIIEKATIDTAVVMSLSDILDSLTVENSRLRVTLRTTPNIETNTRTWELSGEAKADTILKVIRVPVREVVYKRFPAAPCQVVGWPWWVAVLIGVIGVVGGRLMKKI